MGRHVANAVFWIAASCCVISKYGCYMHAFKVQGGHHNVNVAFSILEFCDRCHSLQIVMPINMHMT